MITINDVKHDIRLQSISHIENDYRAFVERGLNFDLSRGNPATEQLELANGLLESIEPYGYKSEDGIDCRGYAGGVLGIAEARRLFAPLLGATQDRVMVAGNSSLTLMHDALAFACLHGVPDGNEPWGRIDNPITFLCPSPGYDRHFRICEALKIKMVPVPMGPDGPDLDMVERLVADPSVKGMWCVPQYSNPTGITYSRVVVDRIAQMETGASDFRVFWDNAYAVHDLTDIRQERVASLIDACDQSGYPNRPFVFASTSKITLPGAGLAFFASSKTNLEWFSQHVGRQTIGPNKINQLQHVRFLRDARGIMAHMGRHRAILQPKFDAVIDTLEWHLSGKGVATWTRPLGGYFISVDILSGGARRVVALALEAGIRLTPAGATFPYGHDEADKNLRIGPSGGTVDELELAAEGLSLAILLAAAEEKQSKSTAEPIAVPGAGQGTLQS